MSVWARVHRNSREGNRSQNRRKIRLPRILIDGVLIDCFGAVAQLEERLHGMQEVVGSIPVGSTTFRQNPRVGVEYAFAWFCSPLNG